MFRPATVACDADFDCDGDVDLFDFDEWLNCVSGPDEKPSPECISLDFDDDNDVDWADFAVFQLAFTGGL